MIRLAALFASILLVAAGAAAQQPSSGSAVATFAGGCFWCTEADFDKVPGVVSTVSGYIGGRTPAPTYEQVSAGNTGHTEAVQVTFDPSRISYDRLVEIYWRTIDPLDKGGQFCDRGSQYRPEIFVHGETQRQAALSSRRALDESKRFSQPLAVAVTEAGVFTPAESYHQDFYRKNPLRYSLYRKGCGRDARLHALWGDEAGGASLLAH